MKFSSNLNTVESCKIRERFNMLDGVRVIEWRAP